MKTYTNITNAELVRHVDNKPDATPLERELAERLDEVSTEVKMLQALKDEADEAMRLMSQKLALHGAH